MQKKRFYLVFILSLISTAMLAQPKFFKNLLPDENFHFALDIKQTGCSLLYNLSDTTQLPEEVCIEPSDIDLSDNIVYKYWINAVKREVLFCFYSSDRINQIVSEQGYIMNLDDAFVHSRKISF